MRTKKRGILLGNVTNVIIAVLGLMIFGFFVIQIYKLYTNQDSENAKNILETLSAKIEVLKVNESSEILIQGFSGGDDWALVAWGKEEGEAEGKPDKCFGKSCLCACELAGNSREAIGISCQNSGMCKFFDVDSMVTRTLLTSPRQIGANTYTDSDDYIMMGVNIKDIRTQRSADSISLEARGAGTSMPAIAPGG